MLMFYCNVSSIPVIQSFVVSCIQKMDLFDLKILQKLEYKKFKVFSRVVLLNRPSL